MRYWSVLLPADRYAEERLYAHETITLTGVPGTGQIAAGDSVVLVAMGDPPVAFATGTVIGHAADGAPLVGYTRRFFDDPRPVGEVAPACGEIAQVRGAAWAALRMEPSGSPEPTRTWMVSLDIPVEAATPGEAARRFWSYAHDLGPAELAVFVHPSGEELGMRAFVGGVEANQDPEGG